MNNFFSSDNPVFSFFSTVADLILLSIYWLVCCLPLVTLAPATAALYHTVYKVVRREYGTPTQEFFSNFKKNLRQGIVSSLVLYAALALLFVTFSFVWHLSTDDPLSTVYFYLGVVGSLLVLVSFLYFCPLLSRFSMPLSRLFAGAFCLGFRHLLTTLLCLLILAAGGALVYFIFLLVLIVPALCCLAISFPMESVLRSYMPHENDDASGSDAYRWYWQQP